MSSTHWHSCPECYEKYPCDMDCSIAWEDEDDGRQFGSYCVCDNCSRESAPKDVESFADWYKAESQKKNPSKVWWEFYNGFRRKLW